MSIRVLLADDQTLVRTGLRTILEEPGDIDVVGEAANGIEAVTQTRTLQPDVVLMDIRMPRLDGLAATKQIRDHDGAPRILLLTTFDLDEYVYAGLRAGASAFLLKDTLPADLISAIRVVAAGDAVVAPAATRRLIEQFIASTHEPDQAQQQALAGLTDREREVLTHMARGANNADIASQLHISEGTVKTHVGRLMTKLGLRDRVQAVVLAYDTGLVRPRS